MLPSQNVQCPYCWETIEIVYEPDESEMFVCDCTVCCHPIHFSVSVDGYGDYQITPHSEDEL